MNVLILNGSPRINGNTSIAIREMEKVFKESDVEVETVLIGNKDIRGCIACMSCSKTGKCVFNDMVNEIAPKFEKADGLVVQALYITLLQMQLLSPVLTVCSTAHILTNQ